MRKDAGFTLTESLVALAILGIILSAGFEALRTSQRSYQIAYDSTFIIMLAESKMEEFLISRLPLESGEHSGTFSKYPAFQWKVNIVPNFVVPGHSTYKVRVEVTGKGQTIHLVNFLSRPSSNKTK